MRPARTSAIHFLSRLGILVAGFLATVYFTRVLGAAVYGSFVLVLALLYWLIVPSSAVDASIIKRVSEGTEPRAFLTAGLAVNLALAAVVMVAIRLAGPAVDDYVGAPVAGLLAALVGTKIRPPDHDDHDRENPGRAARFTLPRLDRGKPRATQRRAMSEASGPGQVELVGTAHVSAESVEEVRAAIEETEAGTVAVELDEARYRQIYVLENMT